MERELGDSDSNYGLGLGNREALAPLFPEISGDILQIQNTSSLISDDDGSLHSLIPISCFFNNNIHPHSLFTVDDDNSNINDHHHLNINININDSPSAFQELQLLDSNSLHNPHNAPFHHHHHHHSSHPPPHHHFQHPTTLLDFFSNNNHLLHLPPPKRPRFNHHNNSSDDDALLLRSLNGVVPEDPNTSAAASTFDVRNEKAKQRRKIIRDKTLALQQLMTPRACDSKTKVMDMGTVLDEACSYIRLLQAQLKALLQSMTVPPPQPPPVLSQYSGSTTGDNNNNVVDGSNCAVVKEEELLVGRLLKRQQLLQLQALLLNSSPEDQVLLLKAVVDQKNTGLGFDGN